VKLIDVPDGHQVSSRRCGSARSPGDGRCLTPGDQPEAV
jgi:hypothetical protein